MKELDDTLPASTAPEDRASDPAIATGERYRLGSELGRGGMGRVVEAFDTRLGRVVALKEVLPHAPGGIARRFTREVQITARLEHASIVPLYDSGTTPDGRPFYVMRRVSGRPLDQVIASAGGLAQRLALVPNVLAAIDAIAHAHRRGVIHRDLKPSNILVGELGETVVIDWGLAKAIGEAEDAGDPAAPHAAGDSLHTQAGAVFGTPGFMSPEQARGDELGPDGDVFALGATLYHLLAGRPPVTGNSATEVIEATHQRRIVPVVQACPGAPPELIAIVDKALAFDPGARYPDAGALAEDVRRFLTGQLVAAHHYTPRQRLARFVRRHRAALAVGALALISLGALGAFSVRRIVSERDTAHAAQAVAEARQQESEQRKVELEEQRDRLRVWRAEALLEPNPTQAAAVLKELPAGSSQLEEARAIAHAAVVRGVAASIETLPGPPLGEAMSPDGHLLVQTTVSGKLAVYDLDARRRVLERPCPRASRAIWVDGGKSLLVVDGRDPSVLLDPLTGRARPGSPLPAIDYALPSDDGAQVLYIDLQQRPWLYDAAHGTARAVSEGPVGDAVIGGDGSWYALADAHGVTAYDRDGHVLARDAPGDVLTAGPRRLAVRDARTLELSELVLDPRPAWIEHPHVSTAHDSILTMAYLGPKLYVETALHPFAPVTTFSNVVVADVRELFPTRAGDTLVTLVSDGTLRYRLGSVRGTLHLPVPAGGLWLAGRPGRSRVVVAADGRAWIYELDDIVPKVVHVPVRLSPTFVGDDLLLLHGIEPQWYWYDLRAGRLAPAGVARYGYNELLDVDPAGGRALRFFEDAPDRGRLLLEQRGAPDRELAAMPPLQQQAMAQLARFVPGGAIVYADGIRVMAIVGDAAPREVAKLDGDVAAIAPCGALCFAAIGSRGELARGRLDTGALERTRVDLGDEVLGLPIAIDPGGAVLLGAGRRVYRWGRSLTQIATLQRPVAALYLTARGGIAAVEQGLLTEVIQDGQARQVLEPSATAPLVGDEGRMLVGSANRTGLEVVELPSRTTWSLAWQADLDLGTLAVSPGHRVVALSTSGAQDTDLVVAALPRSTGDLGAWLASYTNAEIGPDGALRWAR